MISIARTGTVYKGNKNILKANAREQNWLPQEAELPQTSFLPVQEKEKTNPNFHPKLFVICDSYKIL